MTFLLIKVHCADDMLALLPPQRVEGRGCCRNLDIEQNKYRHTHVNVRVKRVQSGSFELDI